jgi:hypothetical protein
MKIWPLPFNIYLLLFLMGISFGCNTPHESKTAEEKKKAKEASTLRLYLEEPHAGDHSGGVPIYRQSPIMISVDREPFLTEADLQSASVIDVRGGFQIRAQFNGHATLLLENVTVSHKGQRIAIESFFGEMRWLGAPVITHRISNGEIVFTPDATREESERIVRGLSNVVAKIVEKEKIF